jgi:hypothetical protein
MQLVIKAGAAARERLLDEGLSSELFSTMLGASGGPKWLVLSRMDRVIAERVIANRSSPIHLIGSSIGAWRHLSLSLPNPAESIAEFERVYLTQSYPERPSPSEVSTEIRGLLHQLLGREGGRLSVSNERVKMTIVTARGTLPLNRRTEPVVHFATAGVSAAINALGRQAFERCYQRVLFTNQKENHVWRGFNTVHVPVTGLNIVDAIMATGSIPMAMEGIPTPQGAPPGLYWDGGMIDYHFGAELRVASDLVLYPHFFQQLTPGWFDKFHKRRAVSPSSIDNLVLVAPSEQFVARLPGGRIPDRKDFSRFDSGERLRRWRAVIDASEALARDLETLFDSRGALEKALR